MHCPQVIIQFITPTPSSPNSLETLEYLSQSTIKMVSSQHSQLSQTVCCCLCVAGASERASLTDGRRRLYIFIFFMAQKTSYNILLQFYCWENCSWIFHGDIQFEPVSTVKDQNALRDASIRVSSNDQLQSWDNPRADVYNCRGPINRSWQRFEINPHISWKII